MKTLAQRRKAAHHGQPEGGTSVVGTVIILTLLLLIAELILVGGQLAGARAAVSNAAREAARQGSLVQSDSDVLSTVDTVARANMARNGQDCAPLGIDDTGTNFVPGKWVIVRVTCRVKLSEFSGFGLPLPDMDISGSHQESLEEYRAFGVVN